MANPRSRRSALLLTPPKLTTPERQPLDRPLSGRPGQMPRPRVHREQPQGHRAEDTPCICASAESSRDTTDPCD
eukprot:2087372-Alexandrium_andersonii.AAC.1